MEGCPWPLHAMAEWGVENDYPTTVAAITDSVQKSEIYGACSNTYRNSYTNISRSNSYPTLEMRQQEHDKDNELSSNVDKGNINFSPQRGSEPVALVRGKVANRIGRRGTRPDPTCSLTKGHLYNASPDYCATAESVSVPFKNPRIEFPRTWTCVGR